MRLLAGLLLALACWGQEPDVRGVRWGMTEAEVIASEGRDPDERRDGWIYYSLTAVNMPAVMGYHFDGDGRLRHAVYRFVPRQLSNGLWFDDYRRLVKLMTEKYGEPTAEDTVWLRELYRYDPDSWAFAVSIGDLRLHHWWESERTYMALVLRGDSYAMDLRLEYGDRAAADDKPSPEVLKDL